MEASEIVVLLVALAFGVGIVLLFCCIVGKGLQVGCKGCVGGGGAGKWCGGCGGAGKAAFGCCGDACQSVTSCCTSGFRWCGSCCKGAAKDLDRAAVASPEAVDVETGGGGKREKEDEEPLLKGATAAPSGKCMYRGEQRVDRINSGCHGWLSSWCVDCVFLNRFCCDCSWLEMDRAATTAPPAPPAGLPVAQPSVAGEPQPSSQPTVQAEPAEPAAGASPPPYVPPFRRVENGPVPSAPLPALMLSPHTVLRTR